MSVLTEKIEGMRRQLAVNSNSSASDIESIQTIELLGEGTVSTSTCVWLLRLSRML
jgi:hypothetical protein